MAAPASEGTSGGPGLFVAASAMSVRRKSQEQPLTHSLAHSLTRSLARTPTSCVCVCEQKQRCVWCSVFGLRR